MSIIIPVYNAEKYILRCLKSVYNQNLKDFEIILIDDGSNDSSNSQLRHFSDMHDECILIENERNMGVSAARNKGLIIARGKYIMFLDADDAWEAESIGRMLSEAVNYELIVGSFYITCKNGILECRTEYAGMIDRQLYMKKLLKPESQYLYSVLWNKVFLGDIIREHALRFHEDIKVCEDWPFLLSYLEHVSRIYIMSSICYRYSQDNPNSLVRRKRSRGENWYSLHEVYKIIIVSYKNYGIFDECKTYIMNFILNPVIKEAIEIVWFEKKKRIELKRFINSNEVQIIIKNACGRDYYEKLFLRLAKMKKYTLLILILQAKWFMSRQYRDVDYCKVVEMK